MDTPSYNRRLFLKKSGLAVAAGALGFGASACDAVGTFDLAGAMVLRPGDDIQEALSVAKEGTRIVLRSGVYSGRCNVKSGMTLEAYPGELVVISGLVALDDWKEDGGLYKHEMGAFKGRFTEHPSRAANTDFHQDKMRPELVTHAGLPMKQVYARGAVDPGCYFVEGSPHHPQTLYVRLAGSQSIDNVRLAAYPKLLYSSNSNCTDVTVKGITFAFASNTGKQGLIETTGEGWELNNVTSAYANSVGIHARGDNHRFQHVEATESGQMGWLGKVDDSRFTACSNLFPNWKGFDPRWEAGCKFTNSRRNTFIGWYGLGDPQRNRGGLGGPLFWMDISNRENTVREMILEDACKAALMVEHYAEDNVFEDVTIRGVQEYKGAAGVGLQIQSNVKNNQFRRFHIANCESDGVRYKKNERRGPSGDNIFEDFSFEGNDRDWFIEGDLKVLPDSFSNANLNHS